MAIAAGPSLTLSEFVEGVWAPRARRRLAPRTWERDSTVYRNHIAPELGERPIAELDIEDWPGGRIGAKQPASARRR